MQCFDKSILNASSLQTDLSELSLNLIKVYCMCLLTNHGEVHLAQLSWPTTFTWPSIMSISEYEKQLAESV